MRIGTWNLEGRWTPQHALVLAEQACDLWLLTEVAAGTRLMGYAAVTTAADMQPGRAWAAVLSRRAMTALPDPHPASAAALVDDVVVCSSVLPWRSCGGEAPWEGADQAERTGAAVAALCRNLPPGSLVWGGDFNHALEGTEVAGSRAGAERIHDLLLSRQSVARTVGLAHRLHGVASIDHIAVPSGWTVLSAARHEAGGLSDHDLYVLEVRR